MPREFDQKTIASINSMARQFSDATILMHEAIAREVGLSGTDHKYLGILIQQGEMTAGELARFTGLTTGAVTGLIDRFEKKGLVSRRFDKEDRRKVVIVPDTEKANSLLRGIFSQIQTKTLDMLSNFNEQELTIIERYLTAAIAMMKETTTQLNENAKNTTL
ncbi:MarR family transcriptional regulator [Rhodocytophaga rosea]|uniref:MarR family transcriptional regulator n=1 Tax=Rhodocytophaga rosea TaxID=2704465 RepID=A0A6C0GSI4_9BACT|nr:MarR family transcriptional regulator [Rhodocytophaga rosea]QHT71091.1 MarR family transcriptional regulator [Rhodocytophaga rosea]